MERKLEPNAGFVPKAVLPVLVGRAADVDLRLTEPTVSRHHAVIESRDGELVVRDLESTFGTFVNGQRIRERRLKAEDDIRFGQVVLYRVRADGLERTEQRGAGLHVQGLEIAVRNRVLVTFGLYGWNVAPGRFVGILGPSGAGKSMLLRTLAGIRPPSRGVIACGQLSNVWEEIDAHRRHLAYIPQDDVVYPLLTVEENLYLAALLRLGSQVPQEEYQEQVKKSLEFFGLKDHAAKLTRVLSGGQRKRVSVALEWLRGPELFLLDEPTSGLDPANEARLMENLRGLASHGATVICTTHLMEHVYLLDEVLVLGVREHRAVPAYAGDPGELLACLECRSFADLYEKLEQGAFHPLGAFESESGQSSEKGSQESSERRGESGNISELTFEPRRSLRELAIAPIRQLDPIAIRVVAYRTWINLWRDPWMRLMLLGQPVILAVVLAATQFSPGKILGVLFFTTVVACWLGLNNSIRDLVQDRRGYIRDRLAGLAPASYLLAKWLVYGLVGVVQLLLFLCLVRSLVPLVLPESLKEDFFDRSFLGWWGTLWLVYLGGLGVAFIISTLVASEEAAVAWLPILILPQILFSAMATGCTPLKHTDPRPFRPIIVTIQHPWTAAEGTHNGQEPGELSDMAAAVDAASLFLVCRPGVLILEAPQVSGYWRQLWLGDLCHLLILDLAVMLALWFVFRWRESYWPALVGY